MICLFTKLLTTVRLIEPRTELVHELCVNIYVNSNILLLLIMVNELCFVLNVSSI